jgi:hypothetical protein
MYMLIMVLDDTAHMNDILRVWRDAGVSGVTILESTGINRVLPRETPNPGFMGFSQLLGSGRVGHQTLFTVIESMELAEAAFAATEGVLGPLTKPHTGIMFVVPVLQTWGMRKHEEQ